MRTVWLIAVAITSCVACNSNKNSSAWSTKPSATPNAAAATSTPAPASSSSGMGIGPVTSRVELASLDESKEDAGAKLFQEKCTACHKLDEKYIGPALAGVTERRQPEWILNMILNPEVMVQQDPTAKALLAQFIAPMANQHLTREEAECVLVYFREHDEERGESDDDHDHEAEDHEASAVETANGH